MLVAQLSPDGQAGHQRQVHQDAMPFEDQCLVALLPEEALTCKAGIYFCCLLENEIYDSSLMRDSYLPSLDTT